MELDKYRNLSMEERHRIWRDQATIIRRSKAEIEKLRLQKDNAYRERNQLLAALSKVENERLTAYLMRHPDTDADWDDDWRWIVVLNFSHTSWKNGTGQMTWHIHDSDLPLFDHLPISEVNNWDGHDTVEKYRRLRKL